MAVTGLVYSDVTVSFYLALLVSVVILGSFTLLLRPDIGSVNAFFFIQAACTLAIDGATFYFFTDGLKEYPDGPHFSIVFYVTVLGLVAAVFSLIGLWSYNTYTKKWRYRNLFFGTNLVLSMLNMWSIFVYSRKNKSLGIPDKAFVLSGSVMQSVIVIWTWMPGVVLLAHLCPVGMESSMYALLAGCSNIGGSVAQSFGAMVLAKLDVAPSGIENEGGTFRNLWIAALASALFPMVSLIMIPYCVPDALQTEDILTVNPSSCTAGSPWEKMVGGKGSDDAPVTIEERPLIDKRLKTFEMASDKDQGEVFENIPKHQSVYSRFLAFGDMFAYSSQSTV
jgi:hypothetical protein